MFYFYTLKSRMINACITYRKFRENVFVADDKQNKENSMLQQISVYKKYNMHFYNKFDLIQIQKPLLSNEFCQHYVGFYHFWGLFTAYF